MTVMLKPISSYSTGVFDNGAAEIVAHDPASQRLFVVNGDSGAIDILSIADPNNITKVGELEFPVGFAGRDATSVAVHDGLVAVAVPDAMDDEANEINGADPGHVLFYDVNGTQLGMVQVGTLPDMLTFTPDGLKVLVANEGERSTSIDPVGSISIIDLSGGPGAATVTNLGFGAFDARLNELKAEGVRVAPLKSFSQDAEPEYISVTPDGSLAYVTLQENNAVAVIDLATQTIKEILPLGLKDYSRGLPELTTYNFDDADADDERPAIGTTDTGTVIELGGFSGLFFEGVDPDGNLKFITLGDRGPNGDPLPGTGERPFLLPEYQARYVRFTLDEDTGNITLTQQILLTRADGTTPITGLPNIAGVDEVPVEPQSGGTFAPLGYDPFGADIESITVAPDGTFWSVDEYRPAIYHFGATGVLIDRFVPVGTGALANPDEPAGTFGTETLPEEYSTRRANRGFEAGALDTENDIFYAFIQTPLANPNTAASNASSVIRILGIDIDTGAPVAEYIYLLEKPSFTEPGANGLVDKIGDATFLGDGKFAVIERDSISDATGKKYIFEIDLTNATNVLDLDFSGESLEQQSADDLALLGIHVVDKVKVANLPSLGYLPNDKPEGLAVLDDGRLAVINDNDFGVAGSNTVQVGIISFTGSNTIDASDQDGAGSNGVLNLANHEIFGMYMPDGIATFEAGGETYFVTANEGDTRAADVARLNSLAVDASLTPLKNNDVAGRLNVSNVDGNTDMDPALEKILAFGARSFSIWDKFGNLVFDSGDDFERITSEASNVVFNASHTNNSFDNRSDDKGPEPEGVTIGEVGGKIFAFIGLERVGGIMVYDVTSPADASFVQYINNRDFTKDPEDELAQAGDLGPEGLHFIKAEDSPNGKPMLVVANEVSGTTTLYSVTPSIMDIQGAGHQSTLAGEAVTTYGIVTAIVSTGSGRGFYLQDPTGDGDIATSDGIFVFTGGTTPSVAVGDHVEVSGQVSEFLPGNDPTSLTITQIVNVGGGAVPAASISVLSSGNDLPDATIIGQDGRVPPTQNIDDDGLTTFDAVNDGIDFYESLEGMLVQVNDAVVVGPTRPANIGEFTVLADDGEGQGVRTNNGGITVGENDFNPERIIFDDLIANEPIVKVGDHFEDPLTGVVSYSFGSYKVLHTETPVVLPSTLAAETTALEGSANQLTVATYNVLNLNPSVGTPEAGGTLDRLDTLAQSIVNNLKAPDIIALQEIQDDSGATDNGIVTSTQTLTELVQAIANQGGPSYQFAMIDPDNNEDGGAPGANIRVAYLYDPARVTFDEDSLDRIEDPAFDADGGENFEGTRKPLVAAFDFNGETVILVNNHLKSKTGDEPLFGDNQPPDQITLDQRVAQAHVVNDVVESLLADDPDAKIIVLGDLNDFDFSDTLDALKGDDLTNLVDSIPLADRYTFNFEGNSQQLDHILVSEALAAIAEIDIVHMNIDFPDTTLRASDHDPIVSRFTFEEDEPEFFTLQILHASDLEGGVDAIGRAPNFAAIVDVLEDEYENTVILSAGDNYIPGPFFNAAGDPSVQDELRAVYEEYYGLAPGSLSSLATLEGRIDISIMNFIGFDASALGNHEFDLGTNSIAGLIGTTISGSGNALPSQITWIGAQFPYLSSNLDFSGDSALNPLFTTDIRTSDTYKTTATEIADPVALGAERGQKKIAPSTIIEEGGEKIGVIGATTQLLEAISSPGATHVKDPAGDGGVDNMTELAGILNAEVARLIAANPELNKIIVVSHLQDINLEKALAPLLHGVDVMLAGGSDTLLADDTDVLHSGDVAAGDYPFLTTNADGDPVAIVSTDGEYSYVGRLVLQFDHEGKLITDSIDPVVSGAYATTDEVVEELWGAGDPFADGTKGDLVETLVGATEAVVTTKDGNILGKTDVYLEGRRTEIRNEETNLGDLTADANLAYSKTVDNTILVSIKNAGGIRASIGTIDSEGSELPPEANPAAGKEAGDISQLDVENSLRFNNALAIVTLTAAQLLAVLEHGVSDWTPTSTQGKFPQLAGVEFSFDGTQAAGSRVVNAKIVDEDGDTLQVLAVDGELVGDPGRAIRIVTLDFLTTGGDSYPIQGFVNANPAFANKVVLTTAMQADGNFDGDAIFASDGTEQDALAEYLIDNFSETPYGQADTPKSDDERIQNLGFREDSVLDGVIVGTDGNDVRNGTSGNDLMFGGDGDDTLRGFGGDDDLFGGEGNDDLIGGFGNDELDGGAGNDDLRGDAGDDTVLGGAGNDELRGGSGDDDLDGGDDDDELFGNTGDDLLAGGSGNDELDGGFGNDGLEGGEGNDELRGGFGEDDLKGGGGEDDLRGGFGDDELEGGAGNDNLRGGFSEDIFVFTQNTGSDTVHDFNPDFDLIDISDFGFANFGAVQAAMSEVGNTTVIALDLSDGDEAVLIGIEIADLEAAHFILA